MIESFIIAVISLGGTLFGSFSGYKLMAYRLSQLEKKVDKHNSFAERMPVMEEKINDMNHRISDLERG